MNMHVVQLLKLCSGQFTGAAESKTEKDRERERLQCSNSNMITFMKGFCFPWWYESDDQCRRFACSLRHLQYRTR
jgi:hypothetical protein